ncbi:PE-PPE domain-containing protein [Tsukamurella paurometabola]|uniref:PE-PPE domain-containing protein n=1 Tax=Tsukamurella paurometabola TaxID=2061 RepID=UPI000325024E|nr:PE-PPE domain-containing protein [Tsukamurella paurometabola]
MSTIALALGTAAVGAAVWATTVLVVPGTGTKNPAVVPGYQENAVGYYVAPTGACADGCTAAPVPYIAEFWPIPLKGWGGLEGAKWDDSVASGVTSLNTVYAATDKTEPIVIFGYSQGGTVVSDVKRQFAAQPGGVPENVSFVLIGNASRPNGGLFSRPAFLGHIPILDVTFKPGTPTDTSTQVNTTDVAFQYDGVTDFPRYPVNLLATANALAGFWLVHGKYLTPKGDDPATATPIGYTPDEVRTAVARATENCTAANYCQVSGDTRYVTLPAKILPIMLPLLDLGAATGTTAVVRPLVDLISPVTRVLIETGYTRDDYGRQTPFGVVPLLNPFTLTADLASGVVEGVRAAATGTGDASRYLAPKPAPATESTGTPSAAASSTAAPQPVSLTLAQTPSSTAAAGSSAAGSSAAGSSAAGSSAAATGAESTSAATSSTASSQPTDTAKATGTATTEATPTGSAAGAASGTAKDTSPGASEETSSSGTAKAGTSKESTGAPATDAASTGSSASEPVGVAAAA